jgi:lysophospholipase L1-like esterase
MIKSITLLAVLLLATPASSAPEATVWLLGDSITYSYALAFIPQNPQWLVSNLGLGGETSRAAVARVADLLSANSAPTIAVLSWGTNDAVNLWSGTDTTMTPADTAFNIVTVADMLRDAGAVVIIGKPIGLVTSTCGKGPSRVNLQQLAPITKYQRRAIENLARADAMETFQMEHHSECIWWDDAFHPNVPGYQRDVARAVRKAIHVHTKY